MAVDKKTPFGLALRHLREERGMSQGELSTRIPNGCSQAFLSALEKGLKHGTEKKRREIAQALDWKYEAMIDLGNRIISGQDPAKAAIDAELMFDVGSPPITAINQNALVSFRVYRGDVVTKALVWIEKDHLKAYNRKKLRAILCEPDAKTTALVDMSDTEFDPDSLFAVNLGDGLRTRIIQPQNSHHSILLRTLDGEIEATGLQWNQVVIGRCLWYERNLILS